MKLHLLATGAALASIAYLQPYRPFVVSGLSMSPTFSDGQIIIAKVRPHDIARGDVVVFHHDGETMVKRVTYLPGDTIERFWFAGEWQLPGTQKMFHSVAKMSYPKQKFVVPEGSLYVLGDNPYGSVDSRTYGVIPARDVMAVVPNVSTTNEWTLESGHVGSAIVAQM